MLVFAAQAVWLSDSESLFSLAWGGDSLGKLLSLTLFSFGTIHQVITTSRCRRIASEEALIQTVED